jgi:LAS superfamily LD-carboxypeptidase LdcB
MIKYNIVFLAFMTWVAIPVTTLSQKAVKMKMAVDDIDYIMGKFNPASHQDFALIPKSYCDKSGLYLHNKTLEAYKKMHAAAKADGINLTIISATRNFEVQKGIWERKWRTYQKQSSLANIQDKDYTIALKILEYSSMPGTSRHHWGTDIDINSLKNDYFETGEGKKVFEWMQTKGKKFGFILVYTEGRNSGYNVEKWHYTYQPLSKFITNSAKEKVKNDMIKGFLGDYLAPRVDMVKKYILYINPDCF